VSAPPSLNRREFLRAATTSALGIAALGSVANESETKPHNATSLIDTNVSLGRWPFRRLPLDGTNALVAKFRKVGVTQAWAGSFEAVFQKNPASANAWLAKECRKHGRGWLIPFGSVNPTLPDWEEELRRCQEEHQMAGLRLHPNYHGYKLDDPAFVKLLRLATERRLIVQIGVSLEDQRMQNASARAAEVDVSPLPATLKTLPGATVVLLNWFRTVKGCVLKQLADAGEVFFDIATVEGVGGVAKLLEQVPPSRVVFGSHAPFFYFESAVLKLKESALSEEQERAVRGGNARSLLA